MTYIISELGISHNGSLDIARRMIDASVWAGADAVKLQKRTIELVYDGQLDQPRESPWGKTLGEQKRALEFNREQWDQIALYCESLKIPFFASAWDIPSLQFLRPYNCPYNKIASAMVTNLDFIRAVNREPQSIIMSTGLSTMGQIENAVEIIERPLTLLHCVGVYPCPEADLNLRMIQTLKVAFPSLRIGYSGHEASVSPSVVAASLGAEVIERHITLDRTMYGSDQAASLEPHGFKTLVDQIRKLDVIMGDGRKIVTDAEQAVAKKLRYWET